MKLDKLLDYVNDEDRSGLDTIEIKASLGEDGDFYVEKTKETYIFYTEVEADGKITSARDSQTFIGCDKTFKEGKVNKNGEVVREDSWKVVIKTKQE